TEESQKKKDPNLPVDPNEVKAKKEPKVPLPPEVEQHYFKYTAHLDALPFDAEVRYRVKLGDRVVRAATFRTRASANRTARCVVVGDLAQGRAEQRAVAYAISREHPD